MNLLYNDIFLEHDTGLHPENKKRLYEFSYLESTDFGDGEQYLPLVHPQYYIDKVRQVCKDGGAVDHDTVTSARTFEVATQAVAAAVRASQTGDFALVRPPGHHAHADRASGFCLFNNIAIAAQKLVKEGKKVLIIDFDGHLGDGTMDIFYKTNKVMFWSIHQYPAYPGNGFVNEIGEGKGRGYTMNVPLPPGSGDDVWWSAAEYFLPAALQFKPDVVGLSAGFDAHQFDMLLDLRISYAGYYKLGQLFGQHFDNLFAVLEGGYNIEEMPKCLYSLLAGINNEPAPHPVLETTSSRRVIETFDINLYAAMANLRKYWSF